MPPLTSTAPHRSSARDSAIAPQPRCCPPLVLLPSARAAALHSRGGSATLQLVGGSLKTTHGSPLAAAPAAAASLGAAPPRHPAPHLATRPRPLNSPAASRQGNGAIGPPSRSSQQGSGARGRRTPCAGQQLAIVGSRRTQRRPAALLTTCVRDRKLLHGSHRSVALALSVQQGNTVRWSGRASRKSAAADM